MGIKKIHSKSIIHRDIKSHNILLNEKDQCKLGDFGLATVMNSEHIMAENLIGTPWYLSPEIVKGQEVSYESDLWSFGIMLHRMCSLKWPYDPDGDMEFPELIDEIINKDPPPIPDQYSPLMHGLVKNLLIKDKTKRCSIDDILKH